MLCYIPGTGCFQSTRSLKPVLLANTQSQPERERLLHLVIGSPEGVRSVIHTLHKLQYAEQATWSQVITIPESGILITPEQGEVFSLLRRDAPRAS
ncbi:hypothetical protein [Lyngbya confervoides]|uniref:Uncharacterized protein n=1 Tax=Lyngbya confervoides BDU141951 TaxID=1574623 RepID=A0ABD4T3K6_9CYAN|nr:hypothetical protein [Lyngbya confervoides]MCM1983159.1 hypothetical protein [Lyngbya confervoides BDU141951]